MLGEQRVSPADDTVKRGGCQRGGAHDAWHIRAAALPTFREPGRRPTERQLKLPGRLLHLAADSAAQMPTTYIAAMRAFSNGGITTQRGNSIHIHLGSRGEALAGGRRGRRFAPDRRVWGRAAPTPTPSVELRCPRTHAVGGAGRARYIAPLRQGANHAPQNRASHIRVRRIVLRSRRPAVGVQNRAAHPHIPFRLTFQPARATLCSADTTKRHPSACLTCESCDLKRERDLPHA
jgi:hypothetical protein